MDGFDQDGLDAYCLEILNIGNELYFAARALAADRDKKADDIVINKGDVAVAKIEMTRKPKRRSSRGRFLLQIIGASCGIGVGYFTNMAFSSEYSKLGTAMMLLLGLCMVISLAYSFHLEATS